MTLYRVNEGDNSLARIEPTSLSGEGKLETDHLQRWLRDQPEALEPGLFTLAEGYSEWEGSGREIDLLAIDSKGALVVVELKRDEGPFMDLQAVRYAAMVARMTFAQAVAAHERYLRRRSIEGDARERILEHIGANEGGEAEIESTRPRILLAARDFPQELTTAVMWLNDSGLDIRCVRLLPYRLDGNLVLDARQVIPPPQVEDYLVRIRDREAEQGNRSYPDVPWTREDVTLLATRAHRLSVAVLDLLAERVGDWIPWDEAESIVRAAEDGSANWGVAALRHRSRQEFGRDNVPFEQQRRSGDDGKPRSHYRMTGEVAEWWKAARSEARGPDAVAPR